MMERELEGLHDHRLEIRSLSTLTPLRTLRKLILMMAAIGLACILARWGQDNNLFGLYVLAFLDISWVQHAIGEELHDGAHYRLATSRKVNETLSGIYGSSIGISLMNYRERHKLHHRYFGTAHDPDLSQYQTCPIGLKAWLGYLFLNFSGYGAIISLVARQSTLSTGKPSMQHPWFTMVMQVIILLVSVVIGMPLFYFWFWLLPLLTLTYGMSHFRTLLEHWNAESWQDPTSGETCYGAFYDFTSGIQRHILGAQFGYNKHGTHHSLPSIPNYNLDKVVDEDYRAVPETLIRTTTYFSRLSEMLALSVKANNKFLTPKTQRTRRL